MLVFLGELLVRSVAVLVLFVFNWRLNLLERLSGNFGKSDVLQGHRRRLRVGHQGVLRLEDDGVDRHQTCAMVSAVWSVMLVSDGDVVGVEADGMSEEVVGELVSSDGSEVSEVRASQRELKGLR